MAQESKALWWALGSFFTITLLLVGVVYASVDDRLAKSEDSAIIKGESIARIEANVDSIKEDVTRIENKLDKLDEKISKNFRGD